MSPLRAVGLLGHPELAAPGTARLVFRRPIGGGRTDLETAFATSPLRLLTPRNHGDAAWVFLASLGGGLVGGDHLEVDIGVEAGASAFLGTQASTKVYRSTLAHEGARSPRGCSQRLTARVGEGAALTLLPDPVVCFAGARYDQAVDVTLAPGASFMMMDGYTCGRSARGERWAFSRYASRTVVSRGERGAERTAIIDATALDPRHGALAERMGRFDVVLSLLVLGPRFARVREAMLATLAPANAGDAVLVASSPLGSGVAEDAESGCLVRVAAERFETASLTLRSSFAALAHLLGDDPFARKW